MFSERLRFQYPRLFLSRKESRLLAHQVAEFESKTDCEMVFHFRRRLGHHALQRAQQLFHRLGLHRTDKRNVIFIVLALAERQFAIWADQGVHRHTGDELWKRICTAMGERLKNGKRLEALKEAVQMAQMVLEKEQPVSSKGPSQKISHQPIIEGDDGTDSTEGEDS